MFTASQRVMLHNATAAATYAFIGYATYRYIKLHSERNELRVDIARTRDAIIERAAHHTESMEKARAALEEEMIKLEGLDRIWKDRLMRFYRALHALSEYEAQIPGVLAVLHDAVEKFRAAGAALEGAQEREFVCSKGHVISLLLSAQKWQTENGGKDGSQAFSTCQKAFLQFLFRSDPYVGAVQQYMTMIPADATAGTANTDELLSLLQKIHIEAFALPSDFGAQLDNLKCGKAVQESIGAWAAAGGESMAQKAKKTLLCPVPRDLDGCKIYARALEKGEDELRGYVRDAVKIRSYTHLCKDQADRSDAFTERVGRFTEVLDKVCSARRGELAKNVSENALEIFQRALMINLDAF